MLWETGKYNIVGANRQDKAYRFIYYSIAAASILQVYCVTITFYTIPFWSPSLRSR